MYAIRSYYEGLAGALAVPAALLELGAEAVPLGGRGMLLAEFRDAVAPGAAADHRGDTLVDPAGYQLYRRRIGADPAGNRHDHASYNFV